MGILHGPQKTKPKSTQKFWFGLRRVQRKIRIFFGNVGLCSHLRPTWNPFRSQSTQNVCVNYIYLCILDIFLVYIYFWVLVWISGYSFGFRMQNQNLKIYLGIQIKFWVFFGSSGQISSTILGLLSIIWFSGICLDFGYFFVFRVYLCLSSFIWVLNIWTDPYPLHTKNNIYLIGIWIME